jgi:hypothetical protein
MRTRVFCAAAAFAACSLLLTGCGQDDDIVQSHATTSVATPPPFSDSTKARVERRAGTTFEPLDPNTKRPAISFERAKDLARVDFAGILQDRQPAEAQYGLVTNRRTGTRDESGSVRPSMDRRPMWLLLYRDV